MDVFLSVLSDLSGERVITNPPEIKAIELKTFKTRWTFETEDYVSTLDVLPVGDLVYAGTYRGRTVLALDAATGREVWRGGPVSGEPRRGGVVIGGDLAFSGGKPGVLTGVRLQDGKAAFRFASDRILYICGAPVIANGCLFLGDWGDTFYAVDMASAKKLWQLDLKEKFTRSCLVADGRIYFGGEKGSLFRYGDTSDSGR